MKFVQVSNIYLNAKEDSKNFDELLDYCRKEEVKVLFLVGNVFDGTPTDDFLSMIDKKLEALGDIRVFMVLGKSDGDPDVYSNHRFATNLTVFSGECIQRIYIARWNLEITGVSYNGNTWAKIHPNLIQSGKKGGFQVLLLPFLGNDDEMLDETWNESQFRFDYIGLGLKEELRRKEQGMYASGCFETFNEIFSGKQAFIIGNLDAESGKNVQICNLPEAKAMTESQKITSQLEDVVRPELKQYENEVAVRRASAIASLHAGASDVEIPKTEEKAEQTSEQNPKKEEPEPPVLSEAERHFRTLLETVPESKIREKALQYGIRCLRETEEKQDGHI